MACPDYDPERVLTAVRLGLSHFDLAALIKDAMSAGKPVLLKPNLLYPALPEKGVTTHPAVFSAVARVLQEQGASLSFGDSPMGLHKPDVAARKAGILAAAEELGIPFADFESGEDVSFPGGAQNRRFHVAHGALDAGCIVNLPRLKTHGLMGMTGALKNIFGVVPGNLKAEFHIKHPDAEGFGRMIADLNGLIRSRLVIMDAITAMEGNGPGNGDLVPVGVLIFSDDPVAVDAVGCRIMGVDPMANAVIRFSHEAGLGNAHAEAIDMRGEDLARYVQQGFKMPSRSPTDGVPKFLLRFAKNAVVPRPVIHPELCIKCGECVAACPTSPKSLSQEKGAVPLYEYSTCIRCYCCQESCRHGAITLKSSILGRFFGDSPRAPAAPSEIA